MTVLVLALAVGMQGPPPPPPPPPPAPVNLSGPADAPGKPLTGTGVILGRVVDGNSTRGVAAAVVSIDYSIGGGIVAGGPTFPTRRVVTDRNGQFVFRDLPAGRYTFLVNASGYRGGMYGMTQPNSRAQALDLADNGRKRDITLRVWKSSVITGVVTDSAGEPLVAVGVRAMLVEFAAGYRRLTQAGAASTDDRGIYRLAGLAPGEYVVMIPATQTTYPQATIDEQNRAISGGGSLISASTSGGPFVAGGAGTRSGDFVVNTSALPFPKPAADGRMLVYPSTYFPNATVVSQATTVRLGSGDERGGVDLQPRVVPGQRISGRVVGPDGPMANLGVHLISAGLEEFSNEQNFETAVTLTNAKGDFTMLGVPAGQYVLKVVQMPRPTASSASTNLMIETGGGAMSMGMSLSSGPSNPPLSKDPTLSAVVPVSVGDSDVTDVALNLQVGARIGGKVVFEGSAARLPTDQLTRMTVQLDPADGRTLGFFADGRGQFDANGNFQTTGLTPGRYLLRVGGVGRDWTLRSAELDGRDISDVPVTVALTDLSGVVITFTDQPTELTGTVHDASGAVDTAVSILVFPADRARWSDTGRTPRSERLVRPSSGGTYSIPGLPMGDYFIIAIDESQMTANWSDPRNLETFSHGATRVTLANGERKSQDLRTVKQP